MLISSELEKKIIAEIEAALAAPSGDAAPSVQSSSGDAAPSVPSGSGDAAPSVPSGSGDANRQYTLSGSWQSSAGLPRWIAAESTSPVHIAVAVGTALPETFTAGEVNFSVNISLFVRTDLDPSGELLLAYSEKVEALLRSWQAETYQEKLSALSVDNVFYVGDIQGSSGQSPSLNGNLCAVSWPLTIGGSYA